MSRRWWMAACAVTASAVAGVMDFAYQLPVTTDGVGAVYQLRLPRAVYERAHSTTIADVALFNAADEPAPFAISDDEARERVRPAPVTLPLFPLRGAAGQDVTSLHVSVRAAGGAVVIDEQAHGSTQLLGYLLDARAADGPIEALRLHWDPKAQDFSQTIRVETSEDLLHWHEVGSATAVNLRFNGEQFTADRLAVTPTKAPYWRLSGSGIDALALTGVDAEPTSEAGPSLRDQATVQATRESTATSAYVDYRAASPGNMPIDRVNVVLPEINTVAHVDVQVREQAEANWRSLVQFDAHRLAGKGAELVNEAVAVPPQIHRQWRVLMSPAALFEHADTLGVQFGWQPQRLLFVARGAGPYHLAFGSAREAPGAAEPVGTLLSGLTPADRMHIATASVGAVADAGGPARLQPPPAPYPWKNTLMWTLLVAAVLLLTGLAYRLAR